MKDECRIGVFVCHCGVNIGGVVKVPKVVEYAKTLPHVAYAEDNIYTCSEAGIDGIKDAIKKFNLNRVVVASCTPRTHEPLFRSACEEVGLNKYLFEMANIREQCSWVHPKEPEKATEKAKDLVRIAVARATMLEPQTEPEVEIKDSALVIGAGVAGMTAALTLANQGFKVCLIEKEDKVGGYVRRLYKLYPTMEEASKIIGPIIESVKNHENIELLTSTTVEEVGGYVGNFNVTVAKKGEKIPLGVGTIVVACGGFNYEPAKGLYQYGVYDRVITQLQLDQLLREEKFGKPERVVMMQCVGARKGEIRGYELESFPKSDTAKLLRKVLKAKKEEGWPYCSRICCMNAIKNAILIKTVSPETDVIILYSDLRVYKEYEDFYSKARDLEVKFIKILEIIIPEISETPDKRLKVLAYDMLAGREAEFVADWVVLSTPLIPHKDEVILARMLKIPISPDGFLMEAHLKLRPVDTTMDGIYLAGVASGPKDVPETITSAKAAAARAAILMANRKMRSEAITAVVDEDLCIGCGLCEELCPYGAPRVEEGKSKIIDVLCRGCGVCAAECPRRAITMRHFNDQQFLAQVEAAIVPEGLEMGGA